MTGGGRTRTAAASEERLSGVFVDLVDSRVPVWRYAGRHPVRVLQVVRDISGLPRLRATLPIGPEAEVVRDMMLRNWLSRKLTAGTTAVLELPDAPQRYLEGHSRATLRRKVRAARARGTTTRLVRDEEKAELLAMGDRREQAHEMGAYRVSEPHNEDLLGYRLWIAAFDADGDAVAFAVTPYAGEWAVLRHLRSLRPGLVASDARYLLSLAVVEALVDRGVRHLVDTARPHWLPNGLRHFQRMLGYRLARVTGVRVRRRGAAPVPDAFATHGR